MSERPCAECGKVCKPCPDCDRCEKCCEEFNGFDAPSLAPAPADPRSGAEERTNCGRCGGDRFLTSWEDKVRCPECGNADPDDVPAPPPPRSKCYECDKGNTAYALLDGTMAHDIRLQGSRSLVAAPCINAPAAPAPRAEELEYTVQESFVIQPASLAGLPQHPRKGDLVGFLNSQAPVPFSGCQGDYSTVDNIPIWDILKYLRRSRDASA